MKFASCLLFCSAVTALDILCTHYNEMWIVQFEANPLQHWIMSTFGVCTAMALRCGTSSAAVVFLLFLRKHRPKLAIVLVCVWVLMQWICLVSIVDLMSVKWYVQMYLLEQWGIVV